MKTLELSLGLPLSAQLSGSGSHAEATLALTLQLGKTGREPTARPRHTSESVRRMQQAMLSQLLLTSQRPGFLVITQGMLTLLASETQQLGRDARTNSPCSQ